MLHAPRGEVVRGGSVGARTATQCVHLSIHFSPMFEFFILSFAKANLKYSLPRRLQGMLYAPRGEVVRGG